MALLPVPFLLFLLTVLCPPLVNAKTAANSRLGTALSAIWDLDLASRHALGLSTKDQQQQSLPPRPIGTAIAQICNTLKDTRPNDSGWHHSFLDNVDNLLRELNSSSVFQRATKLIAGLPKEENLLAEMRSLWFGPATDGRAAFQSLFCNSYQRSEETADKANPSSKKQSTAAATSFLDLLLGQRDNLTEQRVSTGSSREFELVAVSLCTLLGEGERWKQCSFPIHGGQQTFVLIVKGGKNENGQEKVEEVISQIVPQLFSLPAKEEEATRPRPRPPHPNDDFQQVVEQMWAIDEDRVKPGMVQLNWQGKLQKKQVKDISPDPLFSHVNESFLERPIYAALLELYQAQLFHSPVCRDEQPMDSSRRAKFAKLWGLLTGSSVFRLAYNYLDRMNKTGHNFDRFVENLFDLWFGTYSRCKNVEHQGSSGFEHVFSGEWIKEIVDGHHNWLRFYLLEREGHINYHGYFAYQQDGVIGTIQYKWSGYLKRIGGFLIRTSPAFDFSLFTMCALTQPGDQKCRFKIMDTPMFVSSFTEKCHTGTCLATSYPGIWF